MNPYVSIAVKGQDTCAGKRPQEFNSEHFNYTIENMTPYPDVMPYAPKVCCIWGC
jgi:hypothetical protein